MNSSSLKRSDLSGWLSYLEGMHPTEIDLGLTRIKVVADRLQLDKLADTVITVAGTNGKGTSCAFLESYAQQSGLSVGLYTSPHLIRFNERVKINGEEVDDQALISAFEAVESAREEVSLTYFEFTTLAAFYLFKEADLDVAVLEVGLGGRLDAVNIVDPDLALVTSISVDHEAWLGTDLESIGREKAGVFRKGKPAIYGSEGSPISIKQYANEIKADFYQAGADYTYDTEKESWSWSSTSGSLSLANLIYPAFPVQNVATCLAGLSFLGWPLMPDLINQAIKCVSIRGRMEGFEFEGVRGWLDVAHNPDSARYLANQLISIQDQAGLKPIAIFGSMADKDIGGVINELKDQFDDWLCINLPIDRAMKADQLSDVLSKAGQNSKVFADFSQAFAYFKSLPDCKARPLIVMGSFFTVAEAILYYEK
jgi:dihydrofolate synthase/folylpolyglutamate synthase